MTAMRYVSTRGDAPALGFADVLLAGLAADGGLFVPDAWPARCRRSSRCGAVRYRRARGRGDVALRRPGRHRSGDVDGHVRGHRRGRPTRPSTHPRCAPSCRSATSGQPRCSSSSTARRSPSRTSRSSSSAASSTTCSPAADGRVAILGATSGDTGSAAMDACRGRDHVDIVILFPDGRISDVQRRQMTTRRRGQRATPSRSTGTFDDCQDLVKAVFADAAFRDEVHLSAVNSINWARVMAQIVYYVTAHLAGRARRRSGQLRGAHRQLRQHPRRLGRPSAWACPSTGSSWRPTATTSSPGSSPPARWRSTSVRAHDVSPSMDIQVSSNLERLLFEVLGRDGAAVADLMAGSAPTAPSRCRSTCSTVLRAEFDCGRLDDDVRRRGDPPHARHLGHAASTRTPRWASAWPRPSTGDPSCRS